MPDPPAPIRVLFIEFATHFGGAVKSLAEVIAGIDRARVSPHVLTFQKPAVVGHLFTGVPTHFRRRHTSHLTRASLRHALSSGRWARVVAPAVMRVYSLVDHLYGYYLSILIYRVIRRTRADIVHLNNGLEVSGLRAAAWAHTPCVAHMRGRITQNTTGIMRLSRRHVARVLKKTITVSDLVRTTGIDRGLPPDLLKTIYNPVDMEVIDEATGRGRTIRREHGIPDDRILIGTFGRVMPWKGQRDFLMAAAPILRRRDDVSLLVVGDASDSTAPGYWEEVQQLASEEPLRGRVIITGHQTDVASYYHASDIVVHCSRSPEPFGRVVIEAMACGKAVVAMREGGPAEIITDNVDGLLVPPRSIPALTEAMERLATDSAERERLGRAGRATVERRFSSAVIARQLEALYDELVP